MDLREQSAWIVLVIGFHSWFGEQKLKINLHSFYKTVELDWGDSIVPFIDSNSYSYYRHD